MTDHLHHSVHSVDPPPRSLQQLWDAQPSAWLQIGTTYQDRTESLPAGLGTTLYSVNAWCHMSWFVVTAMAAYTDKPSTGGCERTHECWSAMLTLASKLKREEGVRAGGSPAGSHDASHRVSIRDRLLIKEVAELEANLPNTCKVTFLDVNKLHHFQLAITPDEGYYQGGKFQFEIEVPEAYNMVPPKVKCLTRIWHPNIAETGEICLRYGSRVVTWLFLVSPTARAFNRWHRVGPNAHAKGEALGGIKETGTPKCGRITQMASSTATYPSERATEVPAVVSTPAALGLRPKPHTQALKSVYSGAALDLLNFDDPLNIDAAEHHLRDKPLVPSPSVSLRVPLTEHRDSYQHLGLPGTPECVWYVCNREEPAARRRTAGLRVIRYGRAPHDQTRPAGCGVLWSRADSELVPVVVNGTRRPLLTGR
ncbi:hypothetical protein NFI96_014977, partial [Prochilodus magdalenae]